jgi:hypothetical protein
MLSGSKLDALAAEKVFGWKNVHTEEEFKSCLRFCLMPYTI